MPILIRSVTPELFLGGMFLAGIRRSMAFYRPVHELKIPLFSFFSWQKENALMISKAYHPA
jgi:hypothetical protein